MAGPPGVFLKVSYMIDTYITEQHHESSPYLAHNLDYGGKGAPVKYTGAESPLYVCVRAHAYLFVSLSLCLLFHVRV
jgi:hypothetical protein